MKRDGEATALLLALSLIYFMDFTFVLVTYYLLTSVALFWHIIYLAGFMKTVPSGAHTP